MLIKQSIARGLIFATTAVLVLTGDVMAQTITGVRSMPADYEAGTSVDVSIAIDITTSAPSGLIVTENIPAGWEITSASKVPSNCLGSTGIPCTGQVSWLYFGSVSDATITYAITVPAGESEVKTLNGDLKYSDPANGNAHTTESISGDMQISPLTPADYCGDGVCAGSANGEDCSTCPQDCIGGQGGMCSACWKGRCDGSCNSRKESSTCADCAPSYCCGDGVCSASEDISSCLIDCGCASDADCSDSVSCTTDVCNAGVCENIWPACGINDGCCASGCDDTSDSDCQAPPPPQDCSACFKGRCDGTCQQKKEGAACPDCS